MTNAAVFGKVYFPRLVVPLSGLTSNLVKFAIQFVLFVGVSLIMLLITKPFVRKIKQTKVEPTNADRNIGKTAVVIQQINNSEATGQVKLAGNTWTARTADGEIVEEGQKVVVKEISGVKLIVTPTTQN